MNIETPWFEKRTFSKNQKITEDQFFDFFKTKKIKLGLALTSGTVGVLSNYHAVRYQIEQSRFDMIGSKYANYYAIGVTAFLDLMIIVFYLMRDKKLINISVFTSILISVYANMMLHLTSAGGGSFKTFIFNLLEPGFLIGVIVSLTMALFPILILKHCMEILIQQLDEEKEI